MLGQKKGIATASASTNLVFPAYPPHQLRIKTPRWRTDREDTTYTPPPSRKTSDIPLEDEETFGQLMEREPSQTTLSLCVGAILLCILGYCILFLPTLVYGVGYGSGAHLRKSSE